RLEVFVLPLRALDAKVQRSSPVWEGIRGAVARVLALELASPGRLAGVDVRRLAVRALHLTHVVVRVTLERETPPAAAPMRAAHAVSALRGSALRRALAVRLPGHAGVGSSSG